MSTQHLECVSTTTDDSAEKVNLNPGPPEGGQGCLMSPPCLESQGCHLIPLCSLLSPLLFFCLVLLRFLSLFCLLVHFPELFPENSSIFFVKRYAFFYLAPVQQQGEVSWFVVCAAFCDMTLVFAVMHLYTLSVFFVLLLSIPFLYFLKIWY